MNICYDGSFPESARVPDAARRRPGRAADQLADRGDEHREAPGAGPRRLENHVYYAAVNRVGEERGFRFIGRSRIVDCAASCWP